MSAPRMTPTDWWIDWLRFWLRIAEAERVRRQSINGKEQR